MMARVMILPKAVMNAVGTHLNKHEEVPILFHNPLFDELKTLLSHGVNLTEQVILIIGTEVWHIHQILANGGRYFLHHRRGIGVGPLRIGGRRREKTSNL